MNGNKNPAPINGSADTIPKSRGIAIVVAFLVGVLLLMGGIALFFLLFLTDRGGDEYDGPLTRGEFIARVVHVLETPAATEVIFTDVPVTHPRNAYIAAAVRRGIVRPLEVGLTLYADEPLPVAEAIGLVTRALGAGAVGETVLRGYLTGAWFGAQTTREQAEALLTGMENALASLTAAQETGRVIEYHTHIQVIETPPYYSYTESDGYFTIIVYLADTYILALAPGDTFVFEATAENPGGISGHITDVYHVVGGLVITARKPLVLSEIFIQYEYSVAFDLLNENADILLPLHRDFVYIPDNAAIAFSSGAEITQATADSVRVTFNNQTIDGFFLDGEITVYRPRVYASLALTHVEYLKTAAEARFDNLTVAVPDRGFFGDAAYIAELSTELFIELFTVRSEYSGVWVEFTVWLNVRSDGEFSLEITADFDACFGIRGGRVSARTGIGYAFEYAHYYTRSEVALGMQTRARVLGIPIYGIHGEFGRGFTATDTLQAQCHAGACFIVGIFDVRQVHSLTGWGALRNSAALRFNEDLAYDGLYDTWYIYRGTHRRFSTHPENFEVVPEEEE